MPKVVPLKRVKAEPLKRRPRKPIPIEEAVVEPYLEPVTPDPAIGLLKERLESVLSRMAEIKAQAKDFGARMGNEFNPLEEEAIDIMRELFGIRPDMSTTDVDAAYKGEKATGTLVQRQTPHIDFDGIRPHISKEVWMEITARVGDEKKLAAAIELGHIDPALVAHHTTYTANKPYVMAQIVVKP